MSTLRVSAGRSCRPSFTLVEMLIVTAIIAILVAIMYGGMEAVRLNSQINRSKATVSKLHAIIMGKYQSFRTRRAAIDWDQYPQLTSARHVAQVKLQALREIMRMEMPERVDDLTSSSPRFRWPVGGQEFTVPQTALYLTYQDYMTTLRKQGKDITDSSRKHHDTAAMLYMIVTVGCAQGRESFSEDEIGDVDDDGWPEFLDAWGNPIYFLRWAPAFTDSAIQLTPGARLATPTAALSDGIITLAYAAEKQHDPFDPMRVDLGAYQLIPLIFSAGPDGIYDINLRNTYSYFSDQEHRPYSRIGTPTDGDNISRTTGYAPANGRLDHYDNIHNHRLGTK